MLVRFAREVTLLKGLWLHLSPVQSLPTDTTSEVYVCILLGGNDRQRGLASHSMLSGAVTAFLMEAKVTQERC